MTDLITALVMIALFSVSLLYIYGCDRLKGGRA
jgi:hypothetical protein